MRTALLTAGVVLATAWLWSDRLYVINESGPGFAMINKWTGAIRFCDPGGCINPADNRQSAAIPPPPGYVLD